MDVKDAQSKTTLQEEKTQSIDQGIQTEMKKEAKSIVVENVKSLQGKGKDVLANCQKIEEKKCYRQEDARTVDVKVAMIMMNQILHLPAPPGADLDKVQV